MTGVEALMVEAPGFFAEGWGFAAATVGFDVAAELVGHGECSCGKVGCKKTRAVEERKAPGMSEIDYEGGVKVFKRGELNPKVVKIKTLSTKPGGGRVFLDFYLNRNRLSGVNGQISYRSKCFGMCCMRVI